MYRDVVLASDRAMACSRELPRVRRLETCQTGRMVVVSIQCSGGGEGSGDKLTMCERKLVPRDGALDDARDRLGAGVGTLRRALLAHLVVARHVPGGDVGPALGLAHRPVLEHEVAEHPRLAVVAVGAQPLLPKMRVFVVGKAYVHGVTK